MSNNNLHTLWNEHSAPMPMGVPLPMPMGVPLPMPLGVSLPMPHHKKGQLVDEPVCMGHLSSTCPRSDLTWTGLTGVGQEDVSICAACGTPASLLAKRWKIYWQGQRSAGWPVGMFDSPFIESTGY